MNPTNLRLHRSDPLVVALEPLAAGEAVESVVCLEPIAKGHKVAVADVAEGAAVRKFGQVIGVATSAIAAGAWIHEHNLSADVGLLRTEPMERVSPRRNPVQTLGNAVQAQGNAVQTHRNAAVTVPEITDQNPPTFQGFKRPDGSVGTRNMLGILTTVNCSATVAKLIGREVERQSLLEPFENVDGLAVLTHGSGCGLVPEGDGLANLRRTLAGYARHENFGGVLVLGLGCETNDLSSLFGACGLVESDRLRRFAIQEAGGTADAVTRGVDEVLALAAVANQSSRQPASIEHLCLGLQCGGSDGFSALTANPALGVASDLLVAAGGTVILAETPEIYGAEHLLIERAITPQVAADLRERLNWWQRHAGAHGGVLDNNPSPGNKDGGLTTILEKSLGAVAKAGSAPLNGVLSYSERAPGPGLWFMDSPGFDPSSATGEIASGANLLSFTTGRGSVSGFLPTPSIKLSTNTALFERMPGDIDMDCGTILAGRSIETVGREVFDLLLRVASGEPTKSESWGFGEAEFVPWVPGAVF